jgi:hypothetical protein
VTQPPLSIPEHSRRDRNIGIVALVIGLGLVVGLALGISISFLFNLPSSFHTEVRVDNQVRVSGAVNETRLGTIQFINWNEAENTRYAHYARITDGKYSILLDGGQSYDVYIGEPFQTGYSYEYSLYVPSNITTLTADF